jgi:phosphoglucosamine mutase
MSRFPQVRKNIPVAGRELPGAVLDAAKRLNDELAGRARVLVRPSGTEPVIRILSEAETTEEAEKLCANIAALVSQAVD